MAHTNEPSFKEETTHVTQRQATATPVSYTHLDVYKRQTQNLNDENVENIAYTVESSNFGKYMPATSLTLHREKLLKNLTVEPNVEKFEASVLGKYSLLKPHKKSDFDGVSKSDVKKAELLDNSVTVRTNLQKIVMDPSMKDILYDVCSGLKPISEITSIPNSNSSAKAE